MNTHKMIAGYESQQAFTSIFKSMYKQTPFEYRQNQAHGGYHENRRTAAMKDPILDRNWSTGSPLRFAFPTMVMMIFMGLYTTVDTIFVARFVNTYALSAINIVCPMINSLL